MKIIKFILIRILAKIIGKVWVFACIPFRCWANNYVFNHVLQNDLPLKRLYEREPWFDPEAGGWHLEDVHYLKSMSPGLKGFIEYRRTNTFVYYLVVIFIWGWLDSDSNHDTTDTGYIKTLLEGGGRTSYHEIFRPFLKKIDFDSITYGNAFDLGDVRAEHPFFNFWATLVWNDRNTAMNFQYLWMDY